MKWLTKAMAATAFVGGLLMIAPAAQAGVCPAVGFATDCNITITINPDGSVSISSFNGSPYDGVEDTLVGVVNNSANTINTLHLSGSNIFGFDNDGICSASFLNCNYGPSGYEGPNTSFTVITNSDGFVNFIGGLASGASAYFSLEELVTASNTTVTVPEPGTLALLGLAAAAFGFSRRRNS